MAMYLKEISSTEEKVEIQYFRYENWKEHLSTREGTFDQESLKDNLAEAFKDIAKNTWVDYSDLSLQPPKILVRAELKWYDCFNKDIDCGSRSCNREECRAVHESNFIYGEIGNPSPDMTIVPLEVMKLLIKCMVEGFSAPIFTEFEMVNMETGNTIISCEGVEKCESLVIEIDTTELEATRRVLKELCLLPA